MSATDRYHVGEDAVLYALGMLDERERSAVERHAADCDSCAGLLAQAQDDVATVVQAQPQVTPPPRLDARIAAIAEREASNVVPIPIGRAPRWRAGLAMAVAAALVIGLLPSAYLWEQNRAMHGEMTAQADAMNRLASAPYRTVAFDGMSEGSSARVMYSPDGSWYVVVVRGASHGMQVAWMHQGLKTVLGTAEPHGDVAMLYLPRSHRMDQLALMDGERVVAEAQLAY